MSIAELEKALVFIVYKSARNKNKITSSNTNIQISRKKA